MRWTRGERSENIEDRRGGSFGGGLPLGVSLSGLGIGVPGANAGKCTVR